MDPTTGVAIVQEVAAYRDGGVRLDVVDVPAAQPEVLAGALHGRHHPRGDRVGEGQGRPQRHHELAWPHVRRGAQVQRLQSLLRGGDPGLGADPRRHSPRSTTREGGAKNVARGRGGGGMCGERSDTQLHFEGGMVHFLYPALVHPLEQRVYYFCSVSDTSTCITPPIGSPY